MISLFLQTDPHLVILQIQHFRLRCLLHRNILGMNCLIRRHCLISFQRFSVLIHPAKEIIAFSFRRLGELLLQDDLTDIDCFRRQDLLTVFKGYGGKNICKILLKILADCPSAILNGLSQILCQIIQLLIR